MFQFEFMRNAFIIGGMLALVIPLIGTQVVFKRMSMIGDALSHVSLSGIAIGLILNINPILGALMMALLASFAIEFIQRKLGKYSELAIAIIMSSGIGLSAILLTFVENPAGFNSFLFGSIVTIGSQDNVLVISLCLLIIITSAVFFRSFFFTAFDETSAYISGINVRKTNMIFMVLTAITVSIASRIIGALIVSSLMVIPTATALQLKQGYRKTLVLGMLFSLLSVWGGLTASYYLNFSPGGTIVMTSVIILLLCMLSQSIKRMLT